jgi:hypothetical protein
VKKKRYLSVGHWTLSKMCWKLIKDAAQICRLSITRDSTSPTQPPKTFTCVQCICIYMYVVRCEGTKQYQDTYILYIYVYSTKTQSSIRTHIYCIYMYIYTHIYVSFNEEGVRIHVCKVVESKIKTSAALICAWQHRPGVLVDIHTGICLQAQARNSSIFCSSWTHGKRNHNDLKDTYINQHAGDVKACLQVSPLIFLAGPEEDLQLVAINLCFGGTSSQLLTWNS